MVQKCGNKYSWKYCYTKEELIENIPRWEKDSTHKGAIFTPILCEKCGFFHTKKVIPKFRSYPKPKPDELEIEDYKFGCLDGIINPHDSSILNNINK